MENKISELFSTTDVVCPLKHPNGVFTAAVVGNIGNNLSSTSADFFYGTGLCILIFYISGLGKWG